MKTTTNLHYKYPQEIRVYKDDKHNPFISFGTKKEVRLKGIHQNFPFALQSRVNPYFHSQHPTKPRKSFIGKSSDCFVDGRSGWWDKMGADIHNEVLPLTLQSEIKQHQIISLIKGNY